VLTQVGGDTRLTARVSRSVTARWAELSAGWPVELGVPWQRAELGRITRRHLEITVDDPAGLAFGVRVLLLDGREQRHGYHLNDLLTGDDVRAAAARIQEPGEARRLAGEIDTACEVLAPWRHALMASAATPASYVPSMLHRPDLSRRELAAIVSAMREMMPARLAAVAVPNLPATGRWPQLAAALEDNGFVRVSQPPVVTLQVPDTGWDGYLASFGSSKRNTLRKERARFLAAVTDVALAAHIPDAQLDDAVTLLGQRYAKFGHHEPPDRVRDRLDRFRAVHPAGFIIARRGEEIAGFTAVAIDHAHSRLIPRLGAVGADVPYAYFNLSFYELITWAHRLGLRTVELGTQSYQAKLLRGAALTSRQALVYVRDPALRHAADYAARVCNQVYALEAAELTTGGASRLADDAR
jgi:predicted N-acyltransferase